MSISTISGATTGTSASSSDMSALSGNYQMFLQLLVTQLQNQNPLDPMDSTKFTEQLVQYSSVEQQIKSNQTLSDLKTMFAVQNAMSFVGYVGKTVTVDTSTTDMTDGKATWNFNASAACKDATINVLDANGNVVYTTTESLASGDGKFEWDGQTSDGQTLASGSYTIQISGKDSSGSKVTFKSQISGVVDSLDFSGSVPMLIINGQSISAYKVLSVDQTSTGTGGGNS